MPSGWTTRGMKRLQCKKPISSVRILERGIDEPIVPDGPAAYFVTLPVRTMCDAVRTVGIPAELSLNAGAFLCNQVTYELLHYLATNQLDIPAGFVHLPALPEQVTSVYPPMPSMALETMARGILAVIGALQATVPSPSLPRH